MSFSVFAVNGWAVLVSGVVYFAVGALWYGVFSTAWMKGIGKSRDQLQSKPVNYVVALAAEIGIAFVVAVLLRAFGAAGVPDGIFVGALVWFGLSLLPAIVHYAYEGRSFGLLAINKGYDFLGIVVASIILSVWR